MLGGVIVLVVNARLAGRREERGRVAERIVNIKPYYFDEYLDDKTKDARSALQNDQRLELSESDRHRDTLSKRLQRVGVLIYFDGIPLEFALAMNGYQIVTDWLLIRQFVDEIRDTDRDAENSEKWLQDVPFHRRHAEWLALICWIWANTQSFELPEELQIALTTFERHFRGRERLLQREQLLFESETRIARSATERLREEILEDFRRKPKSTD